MLTADEIRTYLNGPGDFIRRWRKSHKVTLKTLSERAGVSLSHLSDVEIGRSRFSVEHARNVLYAIEHYVG